MKKFFLSACALFGLLATAAAQSDTVNVKLLERQPNPTLFSGLSSMVPGLRYAPTSDATGDYWDSMTIRGKNNAVYRQENQWFNRPYIYVDGLPFFGSLNSLNASNIEKVEVIKYATAIYGIDGANGVICITTKKGNRNRPVSVSFNGYASVSGWSRKPDMPPVDESRMTVVSQQAKQQGIWTDWMDEVSRRAIGQHYDLAVSGGAKIFDYYVSGNYDRRQGVLLGNDAEHLDLLAKININPTPWLALSAGFQHTTDKDWGIPANINSAYWMSPYSYTHSTVPGHESWPNVLPDGSNINPLWDNPTLRKYNNLNIGFSTLWSDDMKKKQSSVIDGRVKLDFPWIPGLTYGFDWQRYSYSHSCYYNQHREYQVNTNLAESMDFPEYYSSRSFEDFDSEDDLKTLLQNRLSYQRCMGDHHLSALLGYRYQKIKNSAQLYQSGASSIYFSSPKTTWDFHGISAALSYRYKDIVVASAVWRKDLFKDIALDNQKSNYSAGMDSFGFNLSWNPVKRWTVRAAYDYNASFPNYLTYIDDHYTQKIHKLDIGVDFQTQDHRLLVSVDLYRNKSKNQHLLNYYTKISNGGAIAITQNNEVVVKPIQYYDFVDVENLGGEILVHGTPIIGDGKNRFRWDSQLNFDLNKNKLLVNKKAVFQNLAVSYGLEANYYFMENKPIDGAYFLNDLTLIMEYLGTTTPLFTVNFANTLSWKGVSLYFNFRWMQGNDGHFLGYNPNSANNPHYPYTYPYWQPRTFLKLKDLVLSYDLPLQVSWLRGASVYLSGTDLFTLTNWDGFDPENASGIPFRPGSARSLPYGTFRTIALGINLNL